MSRLRIQSNAKKVIGSLKKKMNQMLAQGSKACVVVSYNTEYAVYVHEDLTPKNFSKPGTGPKFLEQPARQLASDGTLGREFHAALVGGTSLKEAVLRCGLKVADASREVCPVDTSELVKSLKVRYDTAIGFNPVE